MLLAGIVGCGQPPAGPKAKDKAAGKQDSSKQGLPVQAAPAPIPPSVEPPTRVEPPAPVEPALPVEPPAPVAPAAAVEPAVPVEPASAGWTPPKNPTDLRGDEVIPPGTLEANAKAFKKLALAKDDGVPVGGIGANGVHLDTLAVGAGWLSSRCADLTTTFTIGTNDRVNVCMRIIHSRGTTEELSIEWIKNGKSTRRSKVAVSDMHAYLTRGYLPINKGYEGEWKAVITSSDKTVLGEVSFTVN